MQKARKSQRSALPPPPCPGANSQLRPPTHLPHPLQHVLHAPHRKGRQDHRRAARARAVPGAEEAVFWDLEERTPDGGLGRGGNASARPTLDACVVVVVIMIMTMIATAASGSRAKHVDGRGARRRSGGGPAAAAAAGGAATRLKDVALPAEDGRVEGSCTGGGKDRDLEPADGAGLLGEEERSVRMLAERAHRKVTQRLDG